MCVCVCCSECQRAPGRCPIGPLFNCWPAAQLDRESLANAAKREGDKSAESRVLRLIRVEHRPLAVAVSVAVILAPAVTVTLAPAAAMHGLDLDELGIGG